MMIDRRTFMNGGILVAMPSTLAALLSLSSAATSDASPASGAVPLQPVEARTDSDQVVLRIDGWDGYDDTSLDNQISIKINQAWRTAWR